MPTYSRRRLRPRVTSGLVELTGWQEFSLTHLYRGGVVGLEENFGVDWKDVVEDAWEIHGERLTEEFVTRHPGERPNAWWEWSCPDVERIEGETDVEFLYRCGLIDDAEMAGIQKRARTLAEYNRYRHKPPRHNYIPARDVERFAAAHGLLTDDERKILDL